MNIKTLKAQYQKNPLKYILIAGMFFRLLAVIFSKGFGWIDDQFLVIEVAQSWVDGTDFYKWLPGTPGNEGPEGFSFFYAGFHYLLFSLFEGMGLTDPQTKMFFVRLLHALWSMLIIYFGYKIALILSNQKSANLAGWILSLFWILPFLSVRNLVELSCVPLIMWGTYLLVKDKEQQNWKTWITVGILFGIAFNIRFQILLIVGAMGLVLLIQKRWKETLFASIGGLLTILIFQGIVDYMIWDKPFTQFIEYVNYNMHNAHRYMTSPWYTYVLFLLGILIPPVSIFLILGFFKAWKRLLLLFLPTLLFLIFHSYYPNKQERFVVTIIPFLIVVGVIGWHMIAGKLKDGNPLKYYIKGSFIFFWTLNMLLLFPVSMMYSKKARVETMIYLTKYPDLRHFVIEDRNKDVLRFPPQFYLQKWIHYDALMQHNYKKEFTRLRRELITGKQPGIVLFFEPVNMDQRVAQMKKLYPDLVYETSIEPGFMDKVMHWLNPINDNQEIVIYRNAAVLQALD